MSYETLNFSKHHCIRPYILKLLICTLISSVLLYWICTKLNSFDFNRLGQDCSTNWIHYDKYLQMNLGSNKCSKLGNMLFRIASLYGIGKALKRNAYLCGQCVDRYRNELYLEFPNLNNSPFLGNCLNENTEPIDFAEREWSWENVSHLENYDSENFIALKPSSLQSQTYFHHLRSDILRIFKFSLSTNTKVDDYASRFFNDQTTTKICVHTRFKSDNQETPLLKTQADFITGSINYLLSNLHDTANNVSVILFSDNSPFIYTNIAPVVEKKDMVKQVHVARGLRQIEAADLISRYCDYFVLTSSGTTLEWWIAYLMPDEKQKNVYFNSAFFEKGYEHEAIAFHEKLYFPPEWQRLVLDPEHNEITVQDRSTHIYNI